MKYFLCIFLFLSSMLLSFRENPFEPSDVIGVGYWTNGDRCVPVTYSVHEDFGKQEKKALQLDKAEGLGG